MQERRILIIEQDSLMDESIKQVLGHETNFQIISITPQDEGQLYEKLNLIQPTTIILSQTSVFLRSVAHWFRDCQNFEQLQIILINPFNNNVEIYQKCNFQTTKGQDLVQMIQKQNMSNEFQKALVRKSPKEEALASRLVYYVSKKLKH